MMGTGRFISVLSQGAAILNLGFFSSRGACRVRRVLCRDSADCTVKKIWSGQLCIKSFDPGTDEKRQLFEWVMKKDGPFGQDPATVRIWGVFTGLRDYGMPVGISITMPEVDVYLLERVQP